MMKKIFILAAAAVFVLGMSAPSWAVADFAIGGNIQYEPFWQFNDLGDFDVAGTLNGPEEDSTTDFLGDLDGSSRINFKATVGDVTGFYELGIGSGSGISVRHAWAEWDAGTFQLMVGRNWGLVAFGFTDVTLGFDGAYGNLYDSRIDQIRLTVPGETWAFKVALQTARGQGLLGDAVATEAPIPYINAAVDFAFGEAFPITVSGGFQTYELIGGTIDGEDVMTWALAANGRLNFEALYFAYQVWYAQNPGSGGFTAGPLTVAGAVGADVEDAVAYGGFLRMVVPMETITFNVGGSIEFADYSDLEPVGAVGWEDDSTRWAGYINVIYNFTDNFYMQPEISYFENGDDTFGNDTGNTINVGVHFQANF
jgi:hypothetical protein